MKEAEIKNTITKSMAEPKAPEGLKLSTIERGKAIELGREAEKRLAGLKNAGPSPETKKLAAFGIVGRVMLDKKMKNGMTAEKMAGELLKNEKFSKAANLPADKLLEGLTTGKLLKSMFQPERKSPEIEAPTKAAPVKSGPGLGR